MGTMVTRVIRTVGVLLLGLVLLVMGAWATLALWFFDDASAALRSVLAAVFALLTLTALLSLGWRSWRRRALVVFAAAFALLVLCWRMQTPTNQRDWSPETAVLPYASINGDIITVHNIRNFDYRTETDFTRAYYDKTFNLQQLESVDLIAVYWMGPQIAHIFVSFGFGDQGHLAISIEARKPRGEGFSTLKGFFRQYELYYVVADERDVIRLRTNYRRDPPEEVHVYRVHGPAANGRRLFISYMDRINELKARPEFYNSATTNCTTSIWLQTRVNPGHLPFSWKILISGYVPEYLYEHDMLDTTVPFSELRQRSIVNERAHAADQAPDFSQRIRAAPGSAIK